MKNKNIKKILKNNLKKLILCIGYNRHILVGMLGIAATLIIMIIIGTLTFKVDAMAEDMEPEVIEIQPEQDTEKAEIELEVEEEETDDFKPITLYVLSDSLSVRDGAGLSFEKLGSLYIGDKVKAIGYSDGWYKIDYDGTPAYISEDFVTEENPFVQVESTAYWNEYSRPCANTKQPQAGLTLAGKVEWLGKSCYLFAYNEDGTVGECLGYYEFHDTGYGQESGEGESKILSGKTVGTIENGTCIDVFMNTKDECVDYGRKNVFILFVED